MRDGRNGSFKQIGQLAPNDEGGQPQAAKACECLHGFPARILPRPYFFRRIRQDTVLVLNWAKGLAHERSTMTDIDP